MSPPLKFIPISQSLKLKTEETRLTTPFRNQLSSLELHNDSSERSLKKSLLFKRSF